MMAHRRKRKLDKKRKEKSLIGRPRCGLCEKTGKLIKTECCGQWICDDADEYEPGSFEHNSCYRNHDRYTLCSRHHFEGHEGDWKECEKCKEGIKTEMYVWYGTNEYNFEKLPDPPEYEPTMCAGCGEPINMSGDGFGGKAGKYYCVKCMVQMMPIQ